jgi:hypothetical protein
MKKHYEESEVIKWEGLLIYILKKCPDKKSTDKLPN